MTHEPENLFSEYVELLRPLLNAEAPMAATADSSAPKERLLLQEMLDGDYIRGVSRRDERGIPSDFANITITSRGRALVREFDAAHAQKEAPGVRGGGFAMDIFVSHSSEDRDLAEALVHLLQFSLGLHPDRIRCTSVDGYRLKLGDSATARIKEEVRASKAFIVLLTPASLASTYVQFELGARWVMDSFLGPLMARGTRARNLPTPISDLNALEADNEGQIHQFLRDVADVLDLQRPNPVVYGKHLKRFIELAAIASGPAAVSARTTPELSEQQRSILELLWDNKRRSTQAIAKALSLPETDTEFHVGELEQLGFVDIPVDIDDDSVGITQEGRRYAFRQNLGRPNTQSGFAPELFARNRDALIQNQVLEFLREAKAPRTTEHVASAVSKPETAVRAALRTLVEDEMVEFRVGKGGKDWFLHAGLGLKWSSS